MTTETAAQAVGRGRGGRGSRQRKREAVRRLLRGEEVALVSRAGCDRDACGLARGLSCREASLAGRPTNGEALERVRLKARLDAMLLERELLEEDRGAGGA